MLLNTSALISFLIGKITQNHNFKKYKRKYNLDPSFEDEIFVQGQAVFDRTHGRSLLWEKMSPSIKMSKQRIIPGYIEACRDGDILGNSEKKSGVMYY